MGHKEPAPKIIRNVIGQSLRRQRLARGISQDQLAAKLQRYGWDVVRTAITKIELGERCVTDFELIAITECLGVSVEELMAGVNRRSVRRMFGSLDR